MYVCMFVCMYVCMYVCLFAIATCFSPLRTIEDIQVSQGGSGSVDHTAWSDVYTTMDNWKPRLMGQCLRYPTRDGTGITVPLSG